MASSCQLVRDSTKRVSATALHVKIIQRRIEHAVSQLDARTIAGVLAPDAFEADGVHFADETDPELTALYLLAVDAINFCFWPDHDAIADVKKAKKAYHQFDTTARYLLNSGLPVTDSGPAILVGTPPEHASGADELSASAEERAWHPDQLAVQGLEYEHIAGGLRRALEADRGCLDPARLEAIDGPGLRALLGWPRTLPLERERARLLREIGIGLNRHWGGRVTALIEAAQKSAPCLVDLVAQTFPGFRDQCVHPRDGSQVYLMKRAQIFVADVWGRFRGRGLGDFGESIGELTTFADYRVPVVLRELGILKYAPALEQTVESRGSVPAGSEEEIEIRAATVQAVERIRKALEARLRDEIELCPELGSGRGDRPPVTCVALDWWLWTRGEKLRDQSPPHHKTITTCY